MSSSGETYQLVYFPYLGLDAGRKLSFGTQSVWDASQLADRVPEGPIRSRVAELLESHRSHSGRSGRSVPVKGIGIVAAEADDFSPMAPKRLDDLRELRCALFLSCLSSDLGNRGPNAGLYIRTAENFSFIIQRFVLDSPYISETSGVLVQHRIAGYRIGDVQFPTPSHIPTPLRFWCDTALLGALDTLRGVDRHLLRRILDASSLFIESYHNTPDVDIRARILLQAAAFEVLLELPDSRQRKVFKDRIEEHCSTTGERQFRYKFEAWKGKQEVEERTEKGIWADRFYTLRNHIIHGHKVRSCEYLFRGKQHHLLIVPVFFVHTLRHLIETALAGHGEPVKFHSRITWHKPQPEPDDPEDEEKGIGFRVVTDAFARVVDELVAVGHL